MKNLTAITMIAAILASAGLASAETWYTMPGGSFDTDGGYPWISPETNYNYKIMTSASGPAEGVNQDGTGVGMLGLTYDDFEQFGEVTVSGSFAANSLNLSSSSYIQIGLIDSSRVGSAEDGYMSYMFNDSITITVWQSNGQYKINASDYNLSGGRRSDSLDFDDTEDLFYEMTLDFVNDEASLIIDNRTGWSAPVTTEFGIRDGGGPESFTSAALFANMYNESNQLNALATFGDVSVTPEPATMSLLAIGGLGALLKRKRS